MYVVSKVVRHICVPASDALGFTPYLAAKHLHGSAKHEDQISAMYHTEEAKVESLSLHSVHCDAPQPMQRIGCKMLRARFYAPSTTSSPNFLRSDSPEFDGIFLHLATWCLWVEDRTQHCDINIARIEHLL